MSILKSKRSIFGVVGSVVLLACLAFSSSLYAANASSSITISGLVAPFHSLGVTPINNTDLNLASAITNHVVGVLNIRSNHESGFKILITTQNDFSLNYSGSEIPYTLTLARSSGSLSPGLSEPNTMQLSENGELSFQGEALNITNVNYNVKITTSPSGVLPATPVGEEYSDSITVSIVDL